MTSATARQCVVLLGLFGTMPPPPCVPPQPLLPCGDRPALAWMLREFVRFGVEEFLLLCDDAACMSAQAADALAAGLPNHARLAVVPVPRQAGTGGAVLCARDRLDERFLLCTGDALFDCNLADLLAAAAHDDAAVVGRIMLRRPDHASRAPPVSLLGDRVTAYRADAPVDSGAVTAGIALFTRRLLDALQPGCSLHDDVLPRLAADGALRGTVSSGWFCDLAIPDEIARARQDGPRRLRRSALFMDRDGVLNVDHGWVGTRDRFEWIQGALEAISCATQAGWHVFVVTNQSGVARGFYDEEAVRALLHWMADQAHRAGGTIDDTRYCPYHEDAAVEAYRRAHHWRKPAPGMLLDLIRAWELDPASCRMIGDQASDMQAAASAGVAGHLFPGGNLLDFVRPLLVRPSRPAAIG